MRNARMAEWMLSLVTSPERAASTVGDLMEDPASRGALRFWASVIHTTLSLLARDLAAAPGRMILLGLGGLVAGVLLGGVLGLLYGSVMVAGSYVVGYQVTRGLSGWYFNVSVVVLGVVGQFVVGRMLARRSPGRELAPCIAMTVIGLAVGLLLPAISNSPYLIEDSVPRLVLYQTLSAIPLMAGAITIRRRRFRSS